MTTSHTPTPWQHSPERHTHDYFIHRAGATNEIYDDGTESAQIGDDDGVIGSSEWTWLKPEDAEFIIQACNAHDDLVAAAELILLNIQGRESKLGEPNWKYLSELLECALKQAREPQA